MMGLWPILHMGSFEAVTGQKYDRWLVKFAGWFFVIAGLQLWFAANLTQVIILGVGTAVITAGADIYYSIIKNRISRIYLLDVVPELLFATAWTIHVLEK